MGKKSKRTGRQPTKEESTAAPAPALYYPSDGPSEEELNSVTTSSASLQAKLDQLTDCIARNDRKAFVMGFVPLDLSQADAEGYLQDLTTAPEAEGQWSNLAAEIVAITAGRGVTNIEGDQVTKAIFYFHHPLLPGCDREVVFVCQNPQQGEWRAEG
jgi:hypothetical protein